MIKKCKLCGCNLTTAESNQICENCRKKKRKKQLDAAAALKQTANFKKK